MPKKKKKGFVYETYLEPVCSCTKCGKKHLMCERVRHVPDDTSKFLCIYLCPKCGGQAYLIDGDKEIRRRRYDD